MQQIAASTQRAARPSHNFSGSNPAQPAAQGGKRSRRGSREGSLPGRNRCVVAPRRGCARTLAHGTRDCARSTLTVPRPPLPPSLSPSLPPSLLPSLYPSILSSPTTAAYYYNKMSHESTLVKPAGMLASMAGRP